MSESTSNPIVLHKTYRELTRKLQTLQRNVNEQKEYLQSVTSANDSLEQERDEIQSNISLLNQPCNQVLAQQALQPIEHRIQGKLELLQLLNQNSVFTNLITKDEGIHENVYIIPSETKVYLKDVAFDPQAMIIKEIDITETNESNIRKLTIDIELDNDFVYDSSNNVKHLYYELQFPAENTSCALNPTTSTKIVEITGYPLFTPSINKDTYYLTYDNTSTTTELKYSFNNFIYPCYLVFNEGKEAGKPTPNFKIASDNTDFVLYNYASLL